MIRRNVETCRIWGGGRGSPAAGWMAGYIYMIIKACPDRARTDKQWIYRNKKAELGKRK